MDEGLSHYRNSPSLLFHSLLRTFMASLISCDCAFPSGGHLFIPDEGGPLVSRLAQLPVQPQRTQSD